jgi:hypothetical protein
MHSYTLPYKLDEEWDRVRVTGVSVTIKSENDSVTLMQSDIASALDDERAALLAGDPTVSDANERGQRVISYQPNLPTAHGRITQLAFTVEGKRVKPSVAQAEVEEWFPKAQLSSMSKSSSDQQSALGCSLPFLALLCFVLLAGVLIASISGQPSGESVEQAVEANPVVAAPTNTPGVAPLPAQVVVPAADCSQIADAAQRQQCQQGATLCAEGCLEYPLGCELLVLKGDIAKQSGQKLYYAQQHSQYSQILIEPETGERWFCSAAAAEQAGWIQAP